ncbi:MAG: acyl--CoA ligase [Deltaproteobacteria bacterium]|nr:acyl--CoA ligase [Deltaproteobacteria bacterium]
MPSPKALEGSSDLSAFLRRLASKHGDRPAVIGESMALRFSDLDRAASTWARKLEVCGFGRGTHVGLLGGNGPRWLAAAFGVWRAGATLVPISTFVTPRELGETLSHADVAALIVQPRLRSIDFMAALQQLPDQKSLPQILRLDDVSTSSDLPTTDRSSVDPDSVACILYTSGTTGRPKGVMLTHRSILSTVEPTAARTGLTDDGVLLSSLPLFWVAGLIIRALPTLACGCALALLETFTVDSAIDMMRRIRPTALHLRPPQVGQILSHPAFTADLLAPVTKGGGRSEWYAPHMSAARLITGYGMTEMSGYVTALDWQDSEAARRSELGTLLPGVEARIVAADGTPCDTGRPGQIEVRGPGMFAGYYKEALETGKTTDGWFVTGDIGTVDAAGHFQFSGRSKDLLRIKGINVSPIEVESVLNRHRDVEAAYVVGLPPDGLDQRLVAVLVPKGDHLDADDVRRHVRAELSHYKQPAEYVVIHRSDVPLSGTSKPQRAVLAEIAMERSKR